MKRTFILNEDDTKYMLTDTNPNTKEEPFFISKNELKFDTSAFYDYVFSRIDEDYSVEIKSELNENNKQGIIVYRTIDEIVQGVMDRIKTIKK